MNSFSMDLIGENNQKIGAAKMVGNRIVYNFYGQFINTPSVWELYDKQGAVGRIHWDGKDNFIYQIGPNLKALIAPIIEQFMIKIPAEELGLALDQLFNITLKNISKGVVWAREMKKEQLESEKAWQKAKQQNKTMPNITPLPKSKLPQDISPSSLLNLTIKGDLKWQGSHTSFKSAGVQDNGSEIYFVLVEKKSEYILVVIEAMDNKKIAKEKKSFWKKDTLAKLIETIRKHPKTIMQ